MPSHFAPIPADCKDPANVSSCLEQGLPCAAMGRSFFPSPAISANASCSGSFITDDTVLTAGHCCMELPGKWSPNMVFYLNYDNGASSGKFVPTQMIVPTEWSSSSDRRYDWWVFHEDERHCTHAPPNGSCVRPEATHRARSATRFHLMAGQPIRRTTEGGCIKPQGNVGAHLRIFRLPANDPCSQVPSKPAMMYMTCNTLVRPCHRHLRP